MNEKFNYNTWVQLSPLFRALMMSSTKNGKYAVKKTDLKNGFFFEVSELGLIIKVPFKAVFETNNKLNGILGIKFTSSNNCPSKRLGTCQVPEGATCYGVQGENQSKHKNDLSGVRGMSGSQNGELCSIFWDKFAQSGSLRLKFLEYCDYYNIETLRFNLKGDFRNDTDILILHHLAQSGYFSKIYGYTARDDLARLLFKVCQANEGVITLNGSNIPYNNRFFVTEYIEDILKAKYVCRGDCANCGYCRNLEGETIYCLVHGNGSDSVLNNPRNQQLIRDWSKYCLKWDVCNEFNGNFDPTEAKGLAVCFNKVLKRERVILRTPTPKALVNEIMKYKNDLIKRGII